MINFLIQIHFRITLEDFLNYIYLRDNRFTAAFVELSLKTLREIIGLKDWFSVDIQSVHIMHKNILVFWNVGR